MMIVIDDAAGMTKYIWDYLDIIVIGGKMDIVDDLRKDAYGERQSIREARIELGGLLEDAANEIERLRKSRNEILEEAALDAEGFGGSANDAKNYWAREISESIRELKEKE
jgi:hypothetical protein